MVVYYYYKSIVRMYRLAAYHDCTCSMGCFQAAADMLCQSGCFFAGAKKGNYLFLVNNNTFSVSH